MTIFLPLINTLNAFIIVLKLLSLMLSLFTYTALADTVYFTQIIHMSMSENPSFLKISCCQKC